MTMLRHNNTRNNRVANEYSGLEPILSLRHTYFATILEWAVFCLLICLIYLINKNLFNKT